MALLPRLKVCQDSTGETLTVTDNSGLYNVTTNTGGWGTPNIDVTDPTVATLTVTPPDGIEYEFDLLTHLSATWPTANLVYFDVITLTADLLGGTAGDALADGTYKFAYLLTYSAIDYTQVAEFYLHIGTTACVQGMFADLEVADCSCDTDSLTRALYAWGLHEALRAAVSCGKAGRITDIQAALDKICSNTNNCSTC
jgi:hypothetical protein